MEVTKILYHTVEHTLFYCPCEFLDPMQRETYPLVTSDSRSEEFPARRVMSKRRVMSSFGGNQRLPSP